jgi:hypothetical protein
MRMRCRFAFFFVYIATGYICWLLTKYYKVPTCPLQLFLSTS